MHLQSIQKMATGTPSNCTVKHGAIACRLSKRSRFTNRLSVVILKAGSNR